MTSSSPAGIMREERSKTVSKPQHYRHLKLPPPRNRPANKTPGNFPAVVDHKPPWHLPSFFLSFFLSFLSLREIEPFFLTREQNQS
ncbi:hypothetical protein OIU84_002400 [Salix udensis]|uniref:Uncharacterized protein n=1 Tax=Salix udensis TaxID=889485 RepID=A0AAD6P5B2_9ROSI|nr:hypothetical protein OIU84_002400 [Salix udensis]